MTTLKKLAVRTFRRSHFPLPEETLNSRERLVILAIVSAAGIVALNGLIIYLVGSLG